MKHINHITLNTGHVRKTYPHEIDKELYFVLNRILNDSVKPGGAELFDGYRVKSTHTDGVAIATLYANDDAPILTTACSKYDNAELWRSLHESSTVPLMTKVSDMPAAPFIADRIEQGALLHLDSMSWTGDFARCHGWIALYPDKIRS